MTIVVRSPGDLASAIGRSATGEWLTIEQSRIDAFADATEDRQWIHVDPERAAAGPFGATIAHGYLSLALIPRLTQGLIQVSGVAMAVNYGLDRVRFLQPVTSGSRVRATSTVTAVDESRQGYRVGVSVVVEIDGVDRPALSADTIVLFVPGG